jgi:uncharacterized protein YaaN involved in tellurite resistance
MSELTATATATDELKLTPPEPLPPITPEKAAGLVPLSTDQKSKLEERVDGFIDDLIAQDENSPEFGKRIDQITNMGRKEMLEAANQSNRFLDRPIKAMDRDTNIGQSLIELRTTVEKLDPSANGKLLTKRGFFDKIFGSKINNYFAQYRSAQTHIGGILTALSNGKDELLMDNAAIDVERRKLWEAMGKLEQMIHVAGTLDRRLEEKAAELDSSNPAKAKVIRENALFYARQRTQDLLTQMAVTVQGYLALDLVKKNNVELVKGVERASTTTVGALKTAITVAQAMTNQKLVLEQITALNTTTANIIDGTSQMLKDNTARIHEQAASSTIPVETLQRAFQNIYDTMDAIDTFKLKALDTMKATVTTLEGEVVKSKGYIARAEGATQAQSSVSGAASPLAALEG